MSALHTKGEMLNLKRLVLRAQANNPDAFANLITAYKQDMYRVAKSYLRNDEDVADAMQEAILTCYEKLPSLRNPKYFKTWLIRILINKCNDLIKSGRRYVPLDGIPESTGNDTELVNVEFTMLMDSLDEKYRAVLVLYYGEGFSVKEIGNILELTESAVKARLSRGREKMKTLLNDVYSTKRMEVLV